MSRLRHSHPAAFYSSRVLGNRGACAPGPLGIEPRGSLREAAGVAEPPLQNGSRMNRFAESLLMLVWLAIALGLAVALLIATGLVGTFAAIAYGFGWTPEKIDS